MVTISWELSIFSTLAFSTFRILPRRGRMAWVVRSRPCLAEPPAESPSTMKTSFLTGSFEVQSASFPGSPLRTCPFLRLRSRALLAASLALAASVIFSRMTLASSGFSSRNSRRCWETADSTTGRTSEETSLSLVWEENFGSGSFTEMTATSPSLASSPVVSRSLWSFLPSALVSRKSFSVLVSADLNPVRWVPPSRCGMLLVKQRMFPV